MKQKNKDIVGQIAIERIYRLFELANSAKDRTFSKKYIELALKICKKNKVKIPKDLKYTFCKKCLTLWNNKNFTVRKKEKAINYTCLECGNTKKIKI